MACMRQQSERTVGRRVGASWVACGVVAVAVIGAVAGCTGPTTLSVTIDAQGIVAGVDHLHVVATTAGQTAQSVDVPLAIRPGSVPPSHTVTLVFPSGREGDVTVTA